MAVQEFPRVEVRTSVGRRSVPGMSPGTSISAVLSQDSCCVYQRGDRVVSARGLAYRATGCVCRACVERPVLAGRARHGFAWPSAAQAQADRVNVLCGLHHGAVMRVQVPHPRVIDLGVPKFLQSRTSPPGALLLVHLEQAWLHARVDASGDEGLDLQPFPDQGVLVVPVTIVWSDASRVSKRGSGLILHGLFAGARPRCPRRS